MPLSPLYGVPYRGLLLQVYDTLTKNVLKPSHRDGELMVLSNAQRLAAGCVSGASACVVVFPLETLRTQAAMGQRHMKGARAYFSLAADVVRCNFTSPQGHHATRQYSQTPLLPHARNM